MPFWKNCLVLLTPWPFFGVLQKGKTLKKDQLTFLEQPKALLQFTLRQPKQESFPILLSPLPPIIFCVTFLYMVLPFSKQQSSFTVSEIYRLQRMFLVKGAEFLLQKGCHLLCKSVAKCQICKPKLMHNLYKINLPFGDFSFCPLFPIHVLFAPLLNPLPFLVFFFSTLSFKNKTKTL